MYIYLLLHPRLHTCSIVFIGVRILLLLTVHRVESFCQKVSISSVRSIGFPQRPCMIIDRSARDGSHMYLCVDWSSTHWKTWMFDFVSFRFGWVGLFCFVLFCFGRRRVSKYQKQQQKERKRTQTDFSMLENKHVLQLRTAHWENRDMQERKDLLFTHISVSWGRKRDPRQGDAIWGVAINRLTTKRDEKNQRINTTCKQASKQTECSVTVLIAAGLVCDVRSVVRSFNG